VSFGAALAAIPLPYVLALGGLTAIGAWILLARGQSRPRRTTDRDYAAPQLVDDPAGTDPEYWPALVRAAGDRRGVTRRDGLTAVLIAWQDGRTAERALVLNRTSGGLRLAVRQAVPVGAILKLRARNAPVDTPWAEVVVVWCEEFDGGIEVGCQFKGKLPWSVLLLFG